ncbi:DUF805 domain-containing protein [Roseovarius tibetensis]|uniref:DUF805 domain-containing protein n=1 Tax=Roseovarius tibetensis TaxID=2685897 RepID=UPI003D7F9609
MDFTTAIKTVLTENYVNFQGRAQRSEFWWFALFVFVVSMLLSAFGDVLAGVFGLAVLLPGIAVAVRRLHDVDRSGWWYLLVLIPVLGSLILIFAFFVHRGTTGENRFGPDPHDTTPRARAGS